MGNVIALPAQPRQLNVVRAAVNERARNIRASDTRRQHALGVAFGVMREGGSTGLAVAKGCRDLRDTVLQSFDGGAAA